MAIATTTPAGTTPRTLTRANPAAQLDPVQRFGAIQNALAAALYFVRQPCAGNAEQSANLWAATARANRALTLLKVASAAHAAALKASFDAEEGAPQA